MKFANEQMTPAQQAAFAWKHRERFAAAADHNHAETTRRRRGDYAGRYRNAWAELAGEAG